VFDRHLFTSESVTEGHPDKIADAISDAVLDAILADDPRARVACETLVTTGLACVAGEITTTTYVHVPDVVRATIERIGAREGWRTRHFWRGPAPEIRLFELYEFWVENRIMLELATEDMLPSYLRITNGPAQRELLARRA